MASNAELQKQIEELKQLLAAAGIGVPSQASGIIPLEQRQDYIPFGSPRHLIFLGLALVEDIEAAKASLYVVHTGEKGSYRLIDEMQAAMLMRPMDPDKGILMVLRQKVSSFESGAPEPFPGAPSRFIPPGDEEYGKLTRIA